MAFYRLALSKSLIYLTLVDKIINDLKCNDCGNEYADADHYTKENKPGVGISS